MSPSVPESSDAEAPSVASAPDASTISAHAPFAPHGLPHQLPGSLSWRLWCDGKDLALKSLHHRFVQGMATGALSKAAFQHYLIQDYVYLQFFGKAYELTLAKCDSHPPEVRKAVEEFLQGVHTELKLHFGYCQSWGVDLSDAKPSPTTTAYTDFLMEVAASDQGVEAVFAAMAPCARLYGFLACQLAESHPNWRDSPYARWIETYSGAEYLAMPALKERLLDAMEGRSQYDELSRLYNRAMQLEFEFFDAQPL